VVKRPLSRFRRKRYWHLDGPHLKGISFREILLIQMVLDPCGRPAVAVWADLTSMVLVPHNGSMPHATPARCKHPRPTTVRTSPPKNLPVQRCQVRASGLQSSQQVGDAPVKLWKQWHEQVKQMFVCC
jgi:hypothetical protein